MAKQKDSSGNFVLGDVVVAAGTATAVGPITLIMPPSADALTIVLNTTVASAGNTVTVTVTGLSASGYTWTIIASTAIAAVGTATLKIGRGLTASANAVVNDMVPVQVQVTTVIAGTVAYGIDYIVEV